MYINGWSNVVSQAKCFRCKKNKVKATLGFLNKLKKFEIQVIKSGGFNKFN